MRYLLLLFLFIPTELFAQTFNLNYRYEEVCTKEQRLVRLELNSNSNNTLAFFGYTQTFTPNQIDNNDHIVWLHQIYEKWKEYYPCAEIKELVTESAKSASEKGDVDLSQPIVIMSADLGWRNGNVFTTTGGYNMTNLKTKESTGMLLTTGTDYVGNIGYYKINPINNNNSFLINSNLLLLQDNILGNITFGLLTKTERLGSYFLFHTLSFGNLNDYRFQDNTIMLGQTLKIINNRRISFSTNTVFSYTYRAKVFTLDYWFEDYLTIKPFVNIGFKITPTFGLNISYTNSFRTNDLSPERWGLLMGGRLLF